MSSPEQRSDLHDQRLAALMEETHPQRWVVLLMGLAVVLLLVGSAAQFVILRDLSASNHRVLTAQIPGLKQQIADKNQALEDAKSISDQEVAAILKLCGKLQALGGDCGRIEIKPPKHPSS